MGSQFVLRDSSIDSVHVPGGDLGAMKDESEPKVWLRRKIHGNLNHLVFYFYSQRPPGGQRL